MKVYRCAYGGGASIIEEDNGYRLIMWTDKGKRFYNKVLKTETSCKRVLSRSCDGFYEEMKESEME